MENKIVIFFGVVIVQIAILFQTIALKLYEFGKIIINEREI